MFQERIVLDIDRRPRGMTWLKSARSGSCSALIGDQDPAKISSVGRSRHSAMKGSDIDGVMIMEWGDCVIV